VDGPVPRIAVTGGSSFLGSRILSRLLEGRRPDQLLSVDVAPSPRHPQVPHRNVDLTEPAADQELLEVFRSEQVDAVVHCAFFTNPQRDADYAHELESIGTLNLLAAAAAAGARRVLVRSFTAVYGASGRNPNFLTEGHPIQVRSGLAWLREKVEAEQHAASFAERYPETIVTSLRFAPLLGPGVRNFYTAIFDRRALPVPMGYDPLIQLLHPEDAAEAVVAALDADCGGAVNVVPRDAMPLRTILHLAGKVPVPVPHPVAYAAADALWAAGLGTAPGGFVDYTRFLCVADGARARSALGFEPRYSTREALEAYLRYRHPAARPRKTRPEEVQA